MKKSGEISDFGRVTKLKNGKAKKEFHNFK